jgi:hypothetical protein
LYRGSAEVKPMCNRKTQKGLPKIENDCYFVFCSPDDFQHEKKKLNHTTQIG